MSNHHSELQKHVLDVDGCLRVCNRYVDTSIQQRWTAEQMQEHGYTVWINNIDVLTTFLFVFCVTGVSQSRVPSVKSVKVLERQSFHTLTAFLLPTPTHSPRSGPVHRLPFPYTSPPFAFPQSSMGTWMPSLRLGCPPQGQSTPHRLPEYKSTLPLSQIYLFFRFF